MVLPSPLPVSSDRNQSDLRPLASLPGIAYLYPIAEVGHCDCDGTSNKRDSAVNPVQDAPIKSAIYEPGFAADLYVLCQKMKTTLTIESLEPVSGEAYPQGTVRITYTSGFDGEQDWALFLPGDKRENTIVYLHGSFSDADQIFTRKDVCDFWLSRSIAGRHALLSVNMRGTSYMSPAATANMTDLLEYARTELGCRKFVLLGGSGGASSAMAYAVVHPENVHGVIAMGMCDILARLDFARQSDNPVLQDLARCAFSAYGGTPEEKPHLYQARSVLAHTDKLTMPIVLTMGEDDALIPVAETRKIASAMRGRSNFVYHEVPGGDHDSALWVDVDLDTLQIRDQAG